MSRARPSCSELTDSVRLAIVRRAEAFRLVEVTERACSRAAHAFHDLDYPEDRDDLRRAVVDTFFEWCNAGRAAKACEEELDQALRNLAVAPIPDEVLP